MPKLPFHAIAVSMLIATRSVIDSHLSLFSDRIDGILSEWNLIHFPRKADFIFSQREVRSFSSTAILCVIQLWEHVDAGSSGGACVFCTSGFTADFLSLFSCFDGTAGAGGSGSSVCLAFSGLGLILSR